MKIASAPAGPAGVPVSGVVSAVNEAEPQAGMRERARAFAEPLLAGETTATGENLLTHADAVADILAGIGGAESIQAAAYLGYACAQLSRPEEVIGKAFGENFARLAIETARLEQLQQRSRAGRADQPTDSEQAGQQTEAVRKMLLAFSRDLRVVLLRLASRLQTLRWCAAQRQPLAPSVLREAHEVFAPLANRLGIWQIKWELEDLIFRAQEPDTYRQIAGLLDEKRTEREAALEQRRAEIETALRAQGIDAAVSGRPKHISSIVRKMRGKGLDFEHVFDVRALRIMVPGVAAHWAYKEAGAKGYAGVSAASQYDAKIAVLRQLLAWERDLSGSAAQHGLLDDRIYVLTPEAAVVELPAGATPVDFAYTVHTDLGHRCRGARVDGVMVPLNTPLANGQTVAITAAKEGGPSRDWLNAELGYLASARAKAKVRAWFNAQHARETIARGREMVEKLLQREGRTATSLEHLATSLGFKSPDALFETVGKDELSLRSIATALHPPEPAPSADAAVLQRKVAHGTPTRGGVLVVGLDSLLTQPARCCKPAPPDPIAGYVTRGRGVSVHRRDCPSFRDLLARDPDRVIDVAWSTPATGRAPAYPVDVSVEAVDRQGLLRDISDVFAREKMNVIGVQTQSVKGWAWMTFTVEVSDTARLTQVLRLVQEVPGVRRARRC